jgi:hypothetical protein
MSKKNKIRRLVNDISGRFEHLVYPFTKQGRKLSEFEGAFENQRAVIIGTGPSLRVEDLEKLEGWKTFACNKIYLAFDKTEWRPDFYSICDVTVAEHCSDYNFDNDFSNTTLINAIITEGLIQTHLPILHYLYSMKYSIEDWKPGQQVTQPESFSKGIFKGGYSVMIEQLQIAYLMGFSDVAVIGADLSYFGGSPIGKRSASGNLIRYEGKTAGQNYFHKDYYRPGEVTTTPQVEKMRIAWEYCRLLYESSGRTLVNASRQSALEHVTRVAFDDLFPA